LAVPLLPKAVSEKLLNETNSSNQTPAYLAAICGHLEIIKIYLSNGLDVNMQYYYGTTMLHIAADTGLKDLVQYLVDYQGININLRDQHKSTPLRLACAKGREEIAAILIQAGANVNMANMHKATPLITAAINGHVKILEMLIAHPEIDISSKAVCGLTAFDFAQRNGHKECVRLLEPYQVSKCMLM